VSITTIPSTDPGEVTVRFWLTGQGGGLAPYHSYFVPIPIGTTTKVAIITDPVKHYVEVLIHKHAFMSATMVNTGPIVVHPITRGPGGLTSALSVDNTTAASPQPTLCQSLIG
jgi:hypothetical protein